MIWGVLTGQASHHPDLFYSSPCILTLLTPPPASPWEAGVKWTGTCWQPLG